VDGGLFGSRIDPKAVTHYGHFPEDVANADGYEIASGHQLTVRQGAWKIENGILQNTTTPSIITFPQTQKNGTYRSKMSLPLDNKTGGIVIDYEDINNYLYYAVDSGATVDMNLIEMYQGTLTTINNSENGANKGKHTQEVTYLRNDKYGLRGLLKTESGGNIWFGEHQLTDQYLENQLNMGYIALNNATIKVSGFVYENILSV
jgi:hypothetical protein